MIQETETNINNKKLAIWKTVNGRSIQYSLQDGFNRIGTITLVIGYVYNNYVDSNVYCQYIEDNYNKSRDKLAYISGLLIYKDYRGKGFGRSLLHHVLNELKGYVVMLHAQTMDYDTMNNESLCKFYQSEGFEFASFDKRSKCLMINNNI